MKGSGKIPRSFLAPARPRPPTRARGRARRPRIHARARRAPRAGAWVGGWIKSNPSNDPRGDLWAGVFPTTSPRVDGRTHLVRPLWVRIRMRGAWWKPVDFYDLKSRANPERDGFGMGRAPEITVRPLQQGIDAVYRTEAAADSTAMRGSPAARGVRAPASSRHPADIKAATKLKQPYDASLAANRTWSSGHGGYRAWPLLCRAAVPIWHLSAPQADREP